jgi:hypothetical protein
VAATFMNTPIERAPRPLSRILRAATLTLVSLSCSLLGLLALTALVVAQRESLDSFVTDHGVIAIAGAVVVTLIVLLVPLWLLKTASRRGALGWPQLTALAGAVAFGFIYLAWDEPGIRQRVSMGEIAPVQPGDETSHALVLRYANGSSASKQFRSPAFIGTALSARDGEKWAQFLREHRTEIETGWQVLTPVRAWWDELAAQPRLGDLTQPRPDAPIMAFQPVRSHAQYAVAKAGLLALDGKGDEAAAAVLRLYDVARKLEATSRTLVRSMMSRVTERMAIETTGFILDRATVSAPMRQALTDALTATVGGPAGVRHLVLLECAYAQSFLSTTPAIAGGFPTHSITDRALGRGIGVLGHVVYNPNTTINLITDWYLDLATLAEKRQIRDLKSKTDTRERELVGGYRVKNLGGRWIAALSTPALAKLVETYWTIEDARAALLVRLKA